MGNSSGGNDELPHAVQLSSFFFDTTEVTQEIYNSLMKSHYKDIYSTPHWDANKGLGDDVAVYYVNWFEAVLFCNARTKEYGENDDTVYTYTSIEGKINDGCRLTECKYDLNKNGFRLPTEAEFEFVSKMSYDYLNGLENPDDYGKYVNLIYNSDSIVQSIDKRDAISGIKNIFGNVMEWCNDWYSPDYYKRANYKNPVGPYTGEEKVVRGGSIYNDKGYFVPWKRHSVNPSIKWNSNYLRPDVGFRCAKNINETVVN